ncbi:hypothetical protein BDQ17DRAFT_174792 [Cyathus striatus]|nr:hypothetical protein BDQ17DRAFT_174792 [Cyathus striatus]
MSLTTPPPSSSPTYPNSTAAAIANFRPSPREIINGIAPHVFDDHRSFRRRRRPSRTPKPYWYTQSNGGVKSSPLRVSAVISWDDHSIYLEPSENDDTRDVIRRASEDGRSTQQQPLQLSLKPQEVPRKLDMLKPPVADSGSISPYSKLL